VIKTYTVIAVSFSLVYLTTPEAVADIGEMEELIVSSKLSKYSALKSETPIVESARSVTIESLEQIIDKGALSLGRNLRLCHTRRLDQGSRPRRPSVPGQPSISIWQLQ